MPSLDCQRLGDLLIASGLAQQGDIEQALARQKEAGGRLGDNMVALGIVSAADIDSILHAKPDAPRSVTETGVPSGFLLQLLIKAVHTANLETPSQMKEVLKLPYTVINSLLEEAVERKLITSVGSSNGASDGAAFAENRYVLGSDGRTWARELLSQCQYVGAAPVSLAAYQDRIKLQRNETNQGIENSTKLAKGLELPQHFEIFQDNDLRAAKTLGIEDIGGAPSGMSGYPVDTVMATVIALDETGRVLFGDETDNYRVRPHPDTFLHVFEDGSSVTRIAA